MMNHDAIMRHPETHMIIPNLRCPTCCHYQNRWRQTLHLQPTGGLAPLRPSKPNALRAHLRAKRSRCSTHAAARSKCCAALRPGTGKKARFLSFDLLGCLSHGSISKGGAVFGKMSMVILDWRDFFHTQLDSQVHLSN